jgi:small subunit ribosomal protein S13
MAKPRSSKSSKSEKGEKLEVKKGIVRLVGKDLDGRLKLHRALLKIKGIGHSLRWPLARLIQNRLNIDPEEKIGNLSDEQIEALDNLLLNLDDSVLPAFLLNRRKDIWSGRNVHLLMNDLEFADRQSVELKKKIRSWQGYRHMRGKKVRGQRTKNTGRRGLAVGVVRKKK